MASPNLAGLEPAARLSAMAEISNLKARYFRLMDTKCWAEWQDVFTPDALMDMAGEAAAMRSIGLPVPQDIAFVWRGSETIRSAVAAALEGVVTVHHGHMGEVELTSPETAQGIWAMEDLILYPASMPLAGFRGYGHYFETYRKVGAAWRIQTLRLARLALCPIPKTPPA